MKKDNVVYLRHILDAINAVEDYTKGITVDDFIRNSMVHDAVIRQIDIIGEAARSISEEFQEQHPSLPWSRMIGIRNKIIHGYFNINMGVVWDTVKEDLPLLKVAIIKLLI
jgi:uncharacterized protein with HEPN domain